MDVVGAPHDECLPVAMTFGTGDAVPSGAR
jgi:hypothetical protein